MKPIDALAFLLYAAGIGFCLSVGRTAWRVDAMSIVIALAVVVLVLAALIAGRWRAIRLRQRAARRRVRTICTATWPERPWTDTH